jgi:hypothetical protein
VLPPFTAVAVKVMVVPVQALVPGETDKVTTGVLLLFTTNTIALEVAVVGVAQVALEVIIQVTLAALVNELVVNELAFVPAFSPFTFH